METYWYLLLIPIFAVLTVVEFYPVLYSLYLSVTGPNGGVTLSYYSQMLSDRDFWSAVSSSITFSVLSVIISLAVALTLTFLVNELAGLRRSFFEGLFVLPLAAAPIAVGVMWGPSAFWDDLQSFLHYPVSSLIHYQIPYFTETGVLFYFPVMAFADAWEWAPLIMLVCLSIINSNPKEIYEAAKLHGATGWQVFTRVMVPTVMRSPVLQFVLVLRFIDAMRAFEIPLSWATWVAIYNSVGYPVDTLSLYLYDLIFVPSNGFPIALVSAIAVALLIVTVLAATTMLRLITTISGGRQG